jgi:hypothetical protein
MEPKDFEQGQCYIVLFEKRIPIEFKFIEVKGTKILCRKQNGEIFNFNELEQFLNIRNVYPPW